MTGAAAQPRIPPLPAGEWDEVATDILAGRVPGGRQGATSNFMTTLAHDSSLMQLVISNVRRLLLSSSLPERDRELVVLRTTWLCGAPYAWAEHVRMAHEAGVDTAAVDRVTVGPSAPGWDGFERALLRAVDQLHFDAVIDDEVWLALAGRYDQRQLLELPMLAGLYHQLSWTQNAAGIAPNDGSDGLAAR